MMDSQVKVVDPQRGENYSLKVILYFHYIGHNTLACKCLGTFTVFSFSYSLRWSLCPQSIIYKKDRHSCIALFILSFVIFTFGKHNIYIFAKAHVMGKMLNVQNNAKVSLTSIKTHIKHSQMIWEILKFDSEWETPSLQNLWLQSQDLHCTAPNPF